MGASCGLLFGSQGSFIITGEYSLIDRRLPMDNGLPMLRNVTWKDTFSSRLLTKVMKIEISMSCSENYLVNMPDATT